MKSMTGYGRGRAVAGGVLLAVELSSVNHRQLDLRLDLPPGWSGWADEIRAILRARLSRGAVTCRVAAAGASSAALPRLNAGMAATMLAQLRRTARDLRIDDDLRASHLLLCPGLWPASPLPQADAAARPALLRALRQALSGLDRMRRAEGHVLTADLRLRLRRLSRLRQQLQARAPRVAASARRRLSAKLQSLRAGDLVSAERIERELIALVTRGDVAEELVRLTSHLQQCVKLLDSNTAAGRALDFMVQEIMREINTLGAKAADALMTRQVVRFKAELERVREQVQNLE